MSQTNGSQPLLEVRHLTKVFGSRETEVRAVDDVSFTVRQGEIVAIVGESGSGKSTLARMLLRLSEPTSGEIIMDGRDVTEVKGSKNLKPYWREVQGIFQNPMASFNQFYSVGRVLRKTLALTGEKYSKDEEREKLSEALRIVGLDPKDTIPKGAHQLSGGQLQRAMIARALLVDPKILIADESTSALDASLRVTILNVLKDLRDRLGMTVLFITHDIGQANYIADRVFVMYQGEMVEQGTVDEVLGNPQHEYTQRLLADVPRLGGWGTEDESALEPASIG
ncbi:MAG TPA: ABC transporter ATP-binding protein [Thermomicrobiales bacterium]|nr:ABC transporter ATP-binding protein [Thermomicrobiales bacterium]